MVIRVLDHVERCYSNDDGQMIYELIRPHLANGNRVTVSFLGVDSVPSSFVNSAFIELLSEFEFDTIKKLLQFADSTKQINSMIKSRFDFEVNERKNLVLV
ncbi:STAS-like domain-containing protein [Tumebacillus lipolyticus]|uniref:STAS-like domain-containing protein n=1 Tax=Tumebacillus lipolyticus TaxID=1280370 RepID=A0ABW5A3C5_9BACL